MTRIKEKLKEVRGRFFVYNIKVKKNNETVKYILKNKSSVIRLGDGELDLINGKSIPYQRYNQTLASELKDILYTSSNKKLVICLPDIFNNLIRYDASTLNWYYANFFYQNRKLLKPLTKMSNWYGSTFISRPYLALRDKSNVGYYYNTLKQIWEDKNLLIVEGKYTRSGEGNDLFNNAKSIHRIICPSKNAYDYKDEIEKCIKKYCKDRLTLIMLGPTAKIIVKDLSKETQIIDLGHIDSEYEWFKRGVKKRTKIPGKHTAEFNNDDNQIILRKDAKFEHEIITEIK